MSMVPSVFPSVEGLDMYASMTPAKEVGGDLYNFVEKGDMLYFCIGDVSGKGVPASLLMAIVTRGFRTLALTGRTPAEIATRLNAELSENNEMGMFVTMFICMYDLKQGRLEYCNAGHNPPSMGIESLEALRLQPRGKPLQCFSWFMASPRRVSTLSGKCQRNQERCQRCQEDCQLVQ